MGVLYFGVGLISGVALTYYLQSKRANDKDNTSDDKLSVLINQNSGLKADLTDITDQLEKTQADNRFLRNQQYKTEDKSDNFELELGKLKRINSSLAKEVEKLKGELNEYEMLYTARKLEIAELEKQIEQYGK